MDYFRRDWFPQDRTGANLILSEVCSDVTLSLNVARSGGELAVASH